MFIVLSNFTPGGKVEFPNTLTVSRKIDVEMEDWDKFKYNRLLGIYKIFDAKGRRPIWKHIFQDHYIYFSGKSNLFIY